MSNARRRRKTPKREVSLPPIMASCLETLQWFETHEYSNAFRAPVDWKALGLPDYPTIISEPMDLATVEDRLRQGVYKTPKEFARDMRLIWSNCLRYNSPESDISKLAFEYQREFDHQFDKILKKYQLLEAGWRETTKTERQQFVDLVARLKADQLRDIVKCVLDRCPTSIEQDEKDSALELEITDLDPETLWEATKLAAEALQFAPVEPEYDFRAAKLTPEQRETLGKKLGPAGPPRQSQDVPVGSALVSSSSSSTTSGAPPAATAAGAAPSLAGATSQKQQPPSAAGLATAAATFSATPNAAAASAVSQVAAAVAAADAGADNAGGGEAPMDTSA